jgi:hypothetical protein
LCFDLFCGDRNPDILKLRHKTAVNGQSQAPVAFTPVSIEGGGETLEQVWIRYLREIFLLPVGIEPESPVIKAVA